MRCNPLYLSKFGGMSQGEIAAEFGGKFRKVASAHQRGLHLVAAGLVHGAAIVLWWRRWRCWPSRRTTSDRPQDQ